jgi:hypothetical protein
MTRDASRLMLPNLVVIGAMKCGTSAVHRYLDLHPDIAMSQPKELNFFFGADGSSPQPPTGERLPDPSRWRHGNWHRGVGWYAAQFPADVAVRGESSPGYTSPSYPDVAARMASVLPHVRLVYLVRDPIARAISQYQHHRADGAEQRPVAEALLDPRSQYIARGRYLERLRPFVERFPREQIAVFAQGELLADRRTTMSALFAFAGVDRACWSDDLGQRWHTPRTEAPELDSRVRARMVDALQDEADELRAFVGRDFPGWTV